VPAFRGRRGFLCRRTVVLRNLQDPFGSLGFCTPVDSGPTEDTTGGGGSHVEQARHSAFDRIPDGIARFADESRSLPVWPAETTVADDLTRAVPGRISRPEASTESVDSGGDRIQGSVGTSGIPKDPPEVRDLTVVWMTGLRECVPGSCRSKPAPSRTSLEAIFVAIILREPEAPKANQRVRRPAAGTGDARSGHLGLASLQIEPRLEPVKAAFRRIGGSRARSLRRLGRDWHSIEWRSDEFSALGVSPERSLHEPPERQIRSNSPAKETWVFQQLPKERPPGRPGERPGIVLRLSHRPRAAVESSDRRRARGSDRGASPKAASRFPGMDLLPIDTRQGAVGIV
jgi:hypothetical protein